MPLTGVSLEALSAAGADQRLSDLCKVMEELSAVAEQKVLDRATRRHIQRLAWRFVAYQAMITLVLFRHAGATANAELIPSPIDQNPCAHWRNPMDMMRQG
jgi:hypothetical protein